MRDNMYTDQPRRSEKAKKKAGERTKQDPQGKQDQSGDTRQRI